MKQAVQKPDTPFPLRHSLLHRSVPSHVLLPQGTHVDRLASPKLIGYRRVCSWGGVFCGFRSTHSDVYHPYGITLDSFTVPQGSLPCVLIPSFPHHCTTDLFTVSVVLPFLE